ncbi:hypothetical protein GCM10020001_018670 [Nonomuraea salmonea]
MCRQERGPLGVGVEQLGAEAVDQEQADAVGRVEGQWVGLGHAERGQQRTRKVGQGRATISGHQHAPQSSPAPITRPGAGERIGSRPKANTHQPRLHSSAASTDGTCSSDIGLRR